MANAKIYRDSTEVERPPAFQEYAASALMAESVRLMSLKERGLFWSMRCYCWLNDSIPVDPAAMASTLGIPEAEVLENLTPRVLSFFELAQDDKNRLVCPALVRQMTRLIERREKQSRGGRKGVIARRNKVVPPSGR